MNEIYLMLSLSLIFLLMTNLLMILSNLLSKKMKLKFEKMTPFESGFDPKNFNRMPFSMRFFLITVIFLIFDVEIALLIPMLSNFMISNLMNWSMMMFYFMLILLIGLIYEWNQGALNWI